MEEELKERSEVSQWCREENRQEVESHNQVHFMFVLTEPDFFFCRFYVLAAVCFMLLTGRSAVCCFSSSLFYCLLFLF